MTIKTINLGMDDEVRLIIARGTNQSEFHIDFKGPFAVITEVGHSGMAEPKIDPDNLP